MPTTSSFLATTTSAAQSTISVLLIVLYGWLARKHGIISKDGESVSSASFSLDFRATLWTEVSSLLVEIPDFDNRELIVPRSCFQFTQNVVKLGTSIFLPCLLFSEIGPSATIQNLKACEICLFSTTYHPVETLTLLSLCLVQTASSFPSRSSSNSSASPSLSSSDGQNSSQSTWSRSSCSTTSPPFLCSFWRAWEGRAAWTRS